MHDFLWFTISWHPFWFIIGLLVCAAVIIMVGRAIGMLVLALFLYGVTVWTPWFVWLPWLFWLAVLVAVAGIVLGVISAGRSGRALAFFGAITALVIALILMSSHVFGLVDPVDVDIDADVPGISTDFDVLQGDLDDERSKRAQNDNMIRKDLGRDITRVTTQVTRQVSSVESEIDSLRESIEDHLQHHDNHHLKNHLHPQK